MLSGFVKRALPLALFACMAPGARAQTNEDTIERLHAEAQAAEQRADYETAIARYQAMLKAAPDLAPAYNNLGALFFKQGNLPQAAATLERGLRLDPKMTSASALLGIVLFQMADYQKARVRLEQAVKANPSDANAQLYLANDLLKLNDFEAAAERLKQLAAQQPRNPHVWYLLGRVYIQLSQQALGKVSDIDPNSVWAHEISAEVLEGTKDTAGAIAEWKKAIEAAPRQPGAHFKLGDLYWTLSQWDKATEQFTLEQQIDPRNCMIDYKLGDIQMRQDTSADQALEKIDKALANCPHLMEARADRGRLLLKLHREKEAIAELEQVAKADPSEPSTHFLLAQAYRNTGQSADAQREMHTFSELEAKARAANAQRAQDAIRDGDSNHP